MPHVADDADDGAFGAVDEDRASDRILPGRSALAEDSLRITDGGAPASILPSNRRPLLSGIRSAGGSRASPV